MEKVIVDGRVDLRKIPIPIHAPKDGGSLITIGVTISKSFNNNRQNLFFQLKKFTTYVSKNVKNVIVVDPDVDKYSPTEIMWAPSIRVDPKKDIFYISYSQGHELDPAGNERGI